MTLESFISYGSFRFLRIYVAVILIFYAAYFLYNPVGGHNGSTLFGHITGALAFAAILYLMWYGMRRRYHSMQRAPMTSYLSEHIWLGIAVVFLVPMHSGFYFGYNVHTGAYILLILTVLSGVVGMYIYRVIPHQLRSFGDNIAITDLLSRIETISREIRRLASGRSQAFTELVESVDFAYTTSFWSIMFGKRKVHSSAINELGADIAKLPEIDREAALCFIGLLGTKESLVKTLEKNVRLQALLRLWLYIHIPIAAALCVAAYLHIILVIYY